MNSTQITLTAFQTITDSNGQYDTWTDIIGKASKALTINSEILGSVLKKPKEVIGGNYEFSNIETKDISYFNDDISASNNNMVQDKMMMNIYTEYMTSIEYSSLDMHSAQDWSNILSDSIAQMFHTKSDMENALSIDTIYKVALAQGNFLIIPNADKDIYIKGTFDIDTGAYLSLATQLIRFIKDVRAKRTKFAKGIQKSQLEWVISEQFSLRMLSAKTYGFGASDKAYGDMESKDEVGKILDHKFRTTMYLERDVEMTEFTAGGVIQNAGMGTGNRLKPFMFSKIIGMLWFIDSLQVFQNTIPFSDRNIPGSRTKDALSWMWRQDYAVLPVYSSANTVMLSSLPTEPAYKTELNLDVPAKDYSKWADFKALRIALYAKQPSMYSKLWNIDGTNDLIKDQATLDAVIAKNTLKWAGTNLVITKEGLLSRK